MVVEYSTIQMQKKKKTFCYIAKLENTVIVFSPGRKFITGMNLGPRTWVPFPIANLGTLSSIFDFG